MTQTDVDVLIVGAGPTGLALACLLAQYGVKFNIIEKNKTAALKSKAIVIQARTLELFEQLGIAEKAIDKGYIAEGFDLMVRGKLRTTINFATYGAGLTKYPFLLILEQYKTEKLLREKLLAYGCDVEWQNDLMELQQHPDFVTATVRRFEKLESIRAKYLVAADGARSAVRSLLKLPFKGESSENGFLLADVAVQGNISRRHITFCLSPNGFAGFFPMCGTDRYRGIGIIPTGMPELTDKEFPTVSQKLQDLAQLPLLLSDPLWISTYKLRHRSVDRFKEHRCFLVGDAAHIHSPASGQGMNTGIQDAFNLAWKLYWVLTGRAQENLLETYHDERFPIARKTLHSTDQFFAFMTDQRALMRWSRTYMVPAVFSAVSKSAGFRSFVFKSVSQIGIRYRKSLLSEQSFYSEADYKAGDRLGTVRLDCNFQAYVVGDPEAQEEIVEILEVFFHERIKIHTLGNEPDVYAVLQSFGIYRDGLVLIRPDGYVAYCSDGFDMNALRMYLNRFFLTKDFSRQTEIEEKQSISTENFIR